jgi:hypothetical protein
MSAVSQVRVRKGASIMVRHLGEFVVWCTRPEHSHGPFRRRRSRLGALPVGPTKGTRNGAALRLAVRVSAVALLLDLVAIVGTPEIQVGHHWEWRGVMYSSGCAECHLHFTAWLALLASAVLAVRAWLRGPRTLLRTLAWTIWTGLLLVLLVFYPLPGLSNGVPIYARLHWHGRDDLHMYTKGHRMSPERAAFWRSRRARMSGAGLPAPQPTEPTAHPSAMPRS